MKTSRPS
ncbi:hypothetical protein Pint_29511 [Pistacia integerrima]|nr:hypothetical protein Pint_29511 [Pistacia integerrima]